MTAPKKKAEAAPKGAASPRGSAAKSELVEVYKILHHSQEPLTVPEIAALMPKTGYGSAAMNAYREHKEATDPTWLEGKEGVWSAAAQREAMIWWVRRIVKSGVHTKKLSVNTKPVQNMHGISVEGTYSAGVAPMVRVKTFTEHSTLVPWTPDLAEKLNRGHAAGMEFIAELDAMRLATKKPTVAEWRALAELAERAIRAKQ